MTHIDERLSLFLLLGQEADRTLERQAELAPSEPILLSESYDLALTLPGYAKDAIRTSEVFKLFFIFENYLRDLVLEVLSAKDKENWWTRVPEDVRTEVEKREKLEEVKAWMNLGNRTKLALTTYPELLKIIDDGWKNDFEVVIRDKSLVQEARHITHLRNAMGHMSTVPPDEVGRIKQVVRDWFRMVSP